MVIVRKFGDVIMWEDLVGYSTDINGKNVLFYQWINEFNKLKVSIDINGNGIYKITEHLTLALGVDRFLKSLKDQYNVDVKFSEIFVFSEDTKSKAEGLIQAGFTNLCSIENNYIVDGIFIQNILQDSELEFLLNKNIDVISLRDIVEGVGING